MLRPEPWTKEALCAETDPEAFFPDKGGSTREAKKLCSTCEVAEQCLLYALANNERFGIWGGQSERERRRILKGKAPLPAFDVRTPPVAVAPPVDLLDVPMNGNTTWTPRQQNRLVELVRAGAADSQIAKGMRVNQSVVGYWRGKAGLIPNAAPPRAKKVTIRGPRTWRRWTDAERDRVRELHGQGLSDYAIAKEIGHTQPDVSRKRRAMGLPSNFVRPAPGRQARP